MPARVRARVPWGGESDGGGGRVLVRGQETGWERQKWLISAEQGRESFPVLSCNNSVTFATTR